MVYKIAVIVVIIFSLVMAFLAVNAFAAQTSPGKGLFISPAYQEQSVSPGDVSNQSISIADYTYKPMTVALTVKKFQVTDYKYKYKFSDDTDHWVKLSKSLVTLQPGQLEKVAYAIDTPSNATPGGHYFAIIASAVMTNSGVAQTGQVASQLFLQAGGKLVKSGSITGGNASFWAFGNSVPYQFDAKNTGNIHYSAKFFGRIDNLIGNNQSETDMTYMLLPGTIKTIEGSVPTPLLPGLYRLTYGYSADFLHGTTKSTLIVFIPPWSVVALLFVLFVVQKFWRAKHKKAARQADA